MDDQYLWFIGGFLFVLTFFPFLKKLAKHRELSKIVDKIPGPRSYPFIGTTWVFFTVPRKEAFKEYIKIAQQYPGGIFRFWNGSTPDIRLTKCEHIETIMKSSKEIDKSHTYTFLKPWLGDGLLIASGSKWFKNRRLITPTFHFTILDGFCEVFGEQANVLIQILEKYSDSGNAVDVFPLVTKTAMDIICETAMGIKINAQQQKGESDYVRAVYDFGEMAITRVFKPWLQSDRVFRLMGLGKESDKLLATLHGFTNKVIQDRQLARKQKTKRDLLPSGDSEIGAKKRHAFLDLLLEANEGGNDMDLEQIRREVDTFMFEGHDTTTSGISWALMLIALHKDVQQKLYDELKSVFGDDKSRHATIQELNDMKYLERVIKESLRLYPSVANISRALNEDIEIAGYKIPKNSSVAMMIYQIHRDERYFPDPEKFDPDRFLPENSEKRHPYAYVPFSAGPRNCIGQKFAILEEKAVLGKIILNYEISSLRKREDIAFTNELILRPVDGLELFFKKRM